MAPHGSLAQCGPCIQSTSGNFDKPLFMNEGLPAIKGLRSACGIPFSHTGGCLGGWSIFCGVYRRGCNFEKLPCRKYVGAGVYAQVFGLAVRIRFEKMRYCLEHWATSMYNLLLGLSGFTTLPDPLRHLEEPCEVA